MFTIPHEESNIVRTPIGTNTQKRRKAKNDLDKRQNYWNGQGKFQVEYDTRLDALPDEGVAGTVSILSSSYIYISSQHFNISTFQHSTFQQSLHSNLKTLLFEPFLIFETNRIEPHF